MQNYWVEQRADEVCEISELCLCRILTTDRYETANAKKATNGCKCLYFHFQQAAVDSPSQKASVYGINEQHVDDGLGPSGGDISLSDIGEPSALVDVPSRCASPVSPQVNTQGGCD